MEQATTLEPIRRTVTVNQPLEEAFQLFTEGMSSWWPLETHSIHHDAHQAARGTVGFDGREGGRVYERTTDGREADWARVVAWEPPRRLVLAWRPNLEPGPTTDVEVTFTPESEGRTRVDLVHSGWEALGERAQAAHDSYHDWGRVLALYADAA
jgi:uncharacterized protein YndB with AHSA1/START domain